jgi:putative peptidoglycan lipid II flippase
VGAGIFLSRIFGFVRQRVFAHFFGTGLFADAWGAALRMPNVIQNLLGEGTLSASVIPVYAELLEEGREEEAGRFAGAALGILTALAAALALLGILLAPALVRLLFWEWSPEKQAITTTLVRILFPMTGVLVVSAWALAILNTHRRFFVSYVAPVLWNVAQIVTLVALGGYLAFGQRALVVALAWGALVGGVLQFAVQVPFVIPHMKGFRLSLGRNVAGVREAIRNFTPVVAARGVVNLTGWIDTVLAGLLATGAVALLGYAQTFYMLPISLFGMSVAASELPELARMRAEADVALARRVSAALRRVAWFLIPSALGYLLLGDLAVGALYETGAFGGADTLATWGILAAFSLGLPATASSRVLSTAFYALHDTRTPARIAYLRVAVGSVTGVLLMFPFDRFSIASRHLGAAGLALGASAGGWLEYVLLRRALTRRIGAHGAGTSATVRIALAAGLAVAAGVGLQLLLPPAHPALLAVETLVPVGVIYLAATAALGVGMPLRRGRTR